MRFNPGDRVKVTSRISLHFGRVGSVTDQIYSVGGYHAYSVDFGEEFPGRPSLFFADQIVKVETERVESDYEEEEV